MEFDVERVARAARINLTPAETAKFEKQIADILDNFKLLEKIDIEGLEPSFHPIKAKSEMRKDIVKKTDFDPCKLTKCVDGKIVGPKVL